MSSTSASSSDSDRRRRRRRKEIPRSDGREARASSMDRFKPQHRSSSDSEGSSGSSDRRNDRRMPRNEFANGESERDGRREETSRRFDYQDRGFDKKDRVLSESEDSDSRVKERKTEGSRKRDLEDRDRVRDRREEIRRDERKDDGDLKSKDADLSRDRKRSGEDGNKARSHGGSGGEDQEDAVKKRSRERVSDEDEGDRGELGREKTRDDEGNNDRNRETRRVGGRDGVRGSPRREERERSLDSVKEDGRDNDRKRQSRRESDRDRVRGSPNREEREGDRNRARYDGEDNDRKRESRRESNRDRVRGSPRREERESNRDRERDYDMDNDGKRESRRESNRDRVRGSPKREERETNRDRGRYGDGDNDRNRETRRESNRDRVRGSPRRDDRDRRRNQREKSDSPPRQDKDRERGNRRDERRKEDVAEEQKGKLKEVSIPMPDPKAGKTGGAYIPPFKLARMMGEVQDKSSNEYQRLSWDALRKSINGLVNKVNATNIKNIIPELFSENMIRGRGLFCRSCMKSQMASPGFTDVFAALAAVVNTKFPDVGKLLLVRIVLQLKRAYKRNDKPQLLAATKFIAHLVNQLVAHEIIALELLTVLLQEPTDDSVEVAVGFVKECGALLQDISPQGLHGIFERFRGILHEGEIDKRVQFLIEGLFAIRKAKFQGFPAIRPELDLVEQEDQFTHEVSLDEEIDPETHLDIFKPNPNFIEDEKAYEDFKTSILGAESSEDEEGSDAGSDDEDEDEDEEDSEEDEEQMKIKDETETNLVNLRRTIYLTIMSSVDFEEAGHKLLKIKLEPGQEMELCIMLLECCSQERTYLRYYGLLGQRFCMINKVHQENFEKCFVQQYSMIHRLETNKLRNVAKFFAHLLGTDALPWHVLAYIRLTEEDTTSSSRIFIKILFQELSEHLGIRLLNERLNDPIMKDSFDSIFPKDNPKNTRFAINFFTSIGLGGITESLREYLKNMPRLIMQQQQPVVSESGTSESVSESSSESGSEAETESSSSESEEDTRQRSKRRRKH